MPQKDIDKYLALEKLINERREFESTPQAPLISDALKTDFNFFDVSGTTLLQYAAKMGDLDKVKQCIEQYGADLNRTLKSKAKFPIQLALENGHLEVAKYLYDKGADCSTVPLCCCKDEKTKQWMEERIKQSFDKSLEVEKPNQFVKKKRSSYRKEQQ